MVSLSYSESYFDSSVAFHPLHTSIQARAECLSDL